MLVNPAYPSTTPDEYLPLGRSTKWLVIETDMTESSSKSRPVRSATSPIVRTAALAFAGDIHPVELAVITHQVGVSKNEVASFLYTIGAEDWCRAIDTRKYEKK